MARYCPACGRMLRGRQPCPNCPPDAALPKSIEVAKVTPPAGCSFDIPQSGFFDGFDDDGRPQWTDGFEDFVSHGAEEGLDY